MSTESASITFSNVDETSIVTLFNGFSAPVKVSQHFTPAQRLQIIKLSQDDFVKWEAMQGLFIQAAQHLTDHQVTLSDQSLVNLVLHDFLQLHTLHDWMNENMSKPDYWLSYYHCQVLIRYFKHYHNEIFYSCIKLRKQLPCTYCMSLKHCF